jgi:hypothetical protein
LIRQVVNVARMKAGSYKDVVRWFKHPCLKLTIVVTALTWLLWEGILWALAPGFWGGSWLHGENDAPLKLANDMFGPVLLVKLWIQEPLGVGGDKWMVLQHWGPYETAARLLLIIGILWLVICGGLFFRMLRRARAPISPTQEVKQPIDEVFNGQRNPRTDLLP